MNEKSRINCIKCKHYFITHEAKTPYGCRAHGFKSQMQPSRVVLASSGVECQLYEPKEAAAKC